MFVLHECYLLANTTCFFHETIKAFSRVMSKDEWLMQAQGKTGRTRNSSL